MRISNAFLYGTGVFVAVVLIDLIAWRFALVPTLCLALTASIVAAVAVRFPNFGAIVGLLVIWVIVVPWTLAFFEVHWQAPGRTLVAWLALGGHALPAFGPFLLRAIAPAKHA